MNLQEQEESGVFHLRYLECIEGNLFQGIPYFNPVIYHKLVVNFYRIYIVIIIIYRIISGTFRLVTEQIIIALIMKRKSRYTWYTSTKLNKAQPAGYFIIEKYGELPQIIKEAEQKKLKVKCVGSGHSFNDVACTTGYLLNIHKLNRFLEVPSFLKDGYCHKKEIVNVEAGITIEDFNIGLSHRGLSIVNMGGIDHQTFSGALSTGTHGSGVDVPALSGMVISIVLVSSKGKVFRIEPDNGISDKSKFDEPGVELIQNDDEFNSVLVSLGCFGVIYSLILEVMEEYWLEEKKELVDWEDIKPVLEDNSFISSNRGAFVYINPYLVKGKRWCLKISHNIIPKERRNLNEATKNLLSSIFGNVPFVYWYSRFQIKYFPRSMPKLILSSLKSLKDKTFKGTAHRVLFQGSEYFKERAYDSETAFDLNSTNLIEILESLFTVAEKFAAEGIIYSSAPFGLRFVKESEAHITPEYHRKVCYIDTPFVKGTPGAEEILEEYQTVMYERGGIPHWGKRIFKFDAFKHRLKEIYPKLETWKNVRNKYDPDRTFANYYSDRFGLTL